MDMTQCTVYLVVSWTHCTTCMYVASTCYVYDVNTVGHMHGHGSTTGSEHW